MQCNHSQGGDLLFKRVGSFDEVQCVREPGPLQSYSTPKFNRVTIRRVSTKLSGVKTTESIMQNGPSHHQNQTTRVHAEHHQGPSTMSHYTARENSSRTCDTKDFLKAEAAALVKCPERGALFLEVYFRKVRKSSHSDEAQ